MIYLCRNENYDEDEGRNIEAYDPEQAAELFAKREDQHGDGVQENQTVNVMVDGIWKTFYVYSQYNVSYHAREEKTL